MESFLNRYRNITVLLLVIFAQLVLLAMQVRNDKDVRVIRLWAMTTVTPAARVAEWFRGGGIGFVRRYILLHEASEENKRLKEEVGKLRLENTFLRNDLRTAEHAQALKAFEQKTPSKMLAGNVIGTAPGASTVVILNRGSAEGVMRGMGVVTPDGIVGKVIASYPTASQVMLVTDPDFAAGVISQKGQVRGTLKGQGKPLCRVDYVPFEEKIEQGEWFYTSGEDRVFPRGLPVGIAKISGEGTSREIWVDPSGIQRGAEDVLIILESVHQPIPDSPPVNQPVYIAPAPPASGQTTADPQSTAGTAPPTGTEADKLRAIYKSVGDAQNHTFGVGAPGTKPPDFTRLPAAPGAPVPPAKQATPPTGAPAAGNPTGNATGAPQPNPTGGAPASQRPNVVLPPQTAPAGAPNPAPAARNATPNPSGPGRSNAATPSAAPPAPTRPIVNPGAAAPSGGRAAGSTSPTRSEASRRAAQESADDEEIKPSTVRAPGFAPPPAAAAPKTTSPPKTSAPPKGPGGGFPE